MLRSQHAKVTTEGILCRKHNSSHPLMEGIPSSVSCTHESGFNLDYNIDSDLSLNIDLKVDSDETENDGVETVFENDLHH